MVSVVGLGLNRLENHPLKQNFNCHCVCTAVMCHKKFAVAAKYTAVEAYMVIIVISMKSKIKFVEEEPIFLLGIAFGFLSLSDHSIVHFFLISFQGGK